MRNKKLLVVAIVVALSLVACGLVLFLTADKECNHEWLDATCSAPKTCKLCQATEGEAQHEWLDATCTEPKHCKNCSKTEGTALGHTGGVADCVSGAECTRCGEEYGEAGAHAYNQQAVKPEALKSAATCQSAAVYYKSCACGLVSTNENDTFTFGDALAHTFDREVANENTLKTEATCQSAAIYYKSCACGAVSESNLDVFTAGELGAHVYDQINVNAAALKTPATCQNAAVYYKSCICGAVSSNDADVFEDGDTADHRYTLVGSTTATCTHGATNTYRCDVCGDEYTDDVGMALGHDTSGVTPVEKAVEGSTCKFVLVYTCKRAGCGAEVEEGTIERHNYIARITKEATCAEDGVKTYTCICGDSYTEVIPKNETSHNWIKGVVTLGTRTDTCSVCGVTKSVTVYEGNKTESTNTNDLKDKEIEINDANINLGGDVLDAIGDKEVTISADKLEGDDKLDLGLSEDQLSQVGDNPIYNFTINDGSENISQFGENNYVTITLPYTLSDGEDVDSIAIWFINDDGELETIKATYSNGYVTFKTNHFSYYTVTRLTPAERCALYGHSYTKQTQEATCTKAGYDLYFCVRCHDQYKDNEVEALGHKFVEVRTEPTCTKAGNITYTCEHCNYSYKTRLSATGHNYVSIENVDATCIANGYEKFECDGCGKTYTTNKNKISHEIEQIIVEATCDREGHTLNKCKNCDYSYANNYTASLGHDYALEGWTWTEDYSSATLKFVCRHDESHTVTREANISVSITRSPCSEFYIKTVYTATVLYDGQMYEDTKETEKGSASHVFGAEWKFDDKEHWHECACGEKADVTEHAFANETVTKEPTCAENGEKTAYCSCGAEHKTEIEALGHDFVEDERKESTCAEEGYTKYVCSDCGEEKIDKIEKIDHDITDTVVDPTCTEGGYTLHECKNCDYSVKDSETAPVGHSYIPNVTAPTCTEKGYTTYICACGESYVDEYVDMIPHNFVEEERKDSTCAEEGFIKYGCSACDEEKVEALPMLAHDVVDTVVEPTCTEGGYTLHECKNCDYSVKDSETKPVDHKYDATVTAPTCTAKGYTTYTCACGDSYVDDYVDMIPHNFVEESRVDSTCAEEGFIKYGCSACDEEKVEALPMLAHDIADTVVAPTCTEDGYTLHECKNCDYSVKDSETKATGHKYTDVVTVPTCTEKGYTTHTCACGESYVDSYVKETGHKYADVVTAPTCTEKGFTTHTCACGETYVDSYVEATGHTESDWIVDEQATTEKEGLKHTECTVCKVTIKEEKIPVVIEGLEFTLNPDKKSYSVTGIGTYKGTEIVIPETHEGLPVTAIGKDAFSNNKKITSVVIPSSVTLIGENAFKNCDGIVEVKLPNGVVTISDNAFFACKALKNIEIPNSVTSIGVMAFSNCGALEYIHFIGNENEWNAIEKGKDWDKGAGKHVIDFEFEVIVPHEHKYNPVVTAPTCTVKGYTTYTCECGESYVDNYVDATGHDYKSVVTAPTCTEKGYTTYTCACGDTYVDNYVDPAHSYETVVTAPTCTEKGYTTYTCACGNSYVGNYVDATGHDYKAVVTAPTCTEKGYTTYTCACGNSYVGDYVEATGHDYKAVVTAPTCTEKGYTTYTCACGDTYVGDYVEATGHIYVDGVCSGCGRGENDCDHTELHEEKIDLSEYGSCEFYFTVATCECGEVKYLVDAGDSECDLEDGETEYIYNDNGQIIGMRITTSCSACGITIYAEMSQEVNGCIETTVINYVFSIDEEVILDGLSMREDYVRHSYEKAEIDLSKYDGCCGGTMNVSQCVKCGDISSITSIDSKCAIDFDNLPDPEITTDANGNAHAIFNVDCPNCDFFVILDTWTEVYSVCEKATFMNYKVSCGEEIIAEYTESNLEDNHEWNTTYELEEGSKSCEDGIKVTDYCSLCETSHTYKNYYHVEREWNVTIDLSEYTECGGSARVDRCKLCGEVTYLHDISFNCDFAEGVEEEILNENGEVCGSKVTFTCKNCGIIATQSEWIENKSVCESYEYSQLQIFVDGKCVLEYLDEEYISNHQYEYTYEIEEGKTCEDGCKVTVKCTVCGYYYTYNTTYHNTQSETINFADYGACGGSASISRCMACNTVTNCNLWENSGCDLETVTEDILDDNGEKLGTRTIQICSECGLTIVTESKIEISEECELISYTATNISINNEEILAVNNTSYWGAAHKYERTYEFDGEPNCLSEYTVIDTCTICGYENRWTRSGHMEEYFEHDLTEYGACKGYVSGYHCSICDQITGLDDFDICYDINNPEFIEEKTDEDGNVHVIAKGTCENCNLTFEIEQWMMQEECLITGKAVFSIYSAETLLYSFTFVQTEARHDIQYEYEMLGKTCIDGVNVIETCSNCDYYYETTYWGHRTQWEEVNLSDYGLCDGFVEMDVCEFCDEITWFNWHSKCNWYFVETTEDGYEINECSNCGAVRYFLSTDGEKDENCNYLHTETHIFYVDGVEVYKINYSQIYGGHNWQYEYEFEGEPNCQSQYKIIETCTECDYSNWWYTSGHRIEWFGLNLSDYGACYGYVEGEHCEICNKITRIYKFDLDCTINDPDTYEEITGDDGLPHTIMTGNCSNCSVIYTIDIWNVAESVCVNVENVRLTLYLNDVCLFDYTEQSWYEQHDYQRSYEFFGETCKDGIKVTEYCTQCDIYNEWTTYGHALEEEYIYLEEYGMCGGYVRETKCIACDYRDYWYNDYCSWSYIEKNDDGLDVYECVNCGATRTTETVEGEKDENCNYYGTLNHTLYKDGVEIAKYSQSFGSSRHNYKDEYIMYGESCEDGWLYKCYCEDCKNTFEEYEYYHHSMMVNVDVDLSGYCDSHNLYINTCPCGESVNYNFYNISYNEELKAYYCADCGLMITVDAVDDEANCKRTYHFNVGTFDGEEFVLVNEYVVDTIKHNYKVSFDMYGTSCEEGYKEIWTCMGCGDSYEGSEYYWHNSYRVEDYDFSDYGACYGYYQRYTCPCGGNAWENFNCCQDTYENIEGYDENGNYYTLYRISCSTCGLVYESKTVSVENTENCTRTLIHTETVVIGENEFVLKSEAAEYQNHSFKDVEYTVSNGVTTIVSVCETCGYSNRFESQQAVLEADENGDYYYDFIFTPEETGIYHIFSLGDGFKRVNLYQLVDDEMVYVAGDNDGSYNFYFSYTLTAGVTYVYRIEYSYEEREGIIDYCFEKLDSISCDHAYNRVFKFMTDSEHCDSGVRSIDFCEYCGRIEYIEERYGHINNTVYSYEINSSDCGAYHYLGVSNCPCGYEFSISTNLDWNEETQSYSCSECGLIASRITEWVEDGCVKYLVTKITVMNGEEELFSGEERIAYSNHNFSDIEYVENGEDVSIIYSCSKCDEVQAFKMNQAVLEDNGAGEFYYDLTFIPEKSDNYIISSMTSGDTYVILYQIVDGEYVEIGRDDDGGYNNNFRLTSWLEGGNTYVYRIRFYSSSNSGTINYVIGQADSQHVQNTNLPCSHNSAYLVTLLPGSKNCNEGAFRADVCTYCGYLHSFTSGNSHFTTQIERVDLEQMGACYGYFYSYSCACGFDNGINLYNFCYDSHNTEDYPTKDENGNWVYSGVYSCSTCGLEVSYSYYDVRDHQTCQLIRYYNVTVSFNGEVALTRHYELAQTSHDYELSFNMYGKSCEDGYREIYTCADCGDSYEGSEYYHHNNYYIQATQPYMAWETPVYCSGHSVNVYSCACGHEFYYNVWGMDWDSELQGYSCSECGLSVYETEEWVEDGCTKQLTDTIVVTFGEEEWYNDFRTVEYENHNFVNNEYVVNGDDKCIISTCDRCDETKTTEIKQADITYHDDGHYYYDFTFTPEENGEYTIMSIGNRNTYVVLYQLVDGELYHMSSNSWGANYGNFKLSYRLEAGATYVYRISYNGVEESGTIDYIFESRVNNNLCNHNTVYFSQLVEGAEICEDGCYYGSICKYCADLSSIREVYDHNTVNKDYLDLDSLGACYGQYYFNSCACGESHNVYIYSCYDSNYSTSEYDENGNLVNIHTRSCSTCGLSYVRSYYTVRDRDNCKLHYYYTVTIMIGDELILEKEYEVAKTQHDYLASFEMYGETCYDGYLVTYTCSDCGDSYEYGESFYHNTYRVYTINTEELGCCEGHSLYVEACPCGYYFNYYYDGLSNNAEDPERYYCDDCELAFRYTYNNVYEGCSRSENKSISITFGDEELYSLEAVVNYFNHSFYDTSAEFIDGAYVINSVCTYCGETRSYSSERVVLTDEDSDGRYSYEFELSVDETKEYYLRFFDDNYKYVYIYRLVDGEREYYYSSAGINNFSVSSILYAGETYIIEIYGHAYAEENVVVDFFMTEKYIYGANCSHGYLSFGCLLEGSETCEDGTLRGSICYQCGRITSIYKENYHNTYIKERIVLSDYGACYGEYILYECACGKEVSISDNASCAYNYTSGSHYDEEGKLIHVDTRTCFNCGLRFDTSYYTVKDRENCALIYYYTVSVTINDQLIVAKSYTREEESHDYEITAEFMEGSTSCDQGVNVTRTCKDCGDTLTYSEYYHNQYAKETIDLEQFGSVCKGYVTVVGCVCGKYNDLYLDNVLCDFDDEYCLLWIENVADKNQWDMSGYWHSRYNGAHIYTCAVTDPEQCAFKIRYAEYWLKDEDSCVAYRYETYQFGYDEDTGACAYEITYKTGEYTTYHDYVETNADGSNHYDCPDCGSYYHEDYYYYEDGNTSRYEKKILNTTGDGNDKYYECIRQYDYDFNGSHYQSRDYEKRIYADDTEWYRERTWTPYVGTFGKPGWEVKSTSHDRYGYENEEHYAYVYLNGFASSGYEYSNWEYYIFQYYTDGANWQKYDYTYTFDGECIRTTVYTDNNGANETTVDNYCRMYRTESLEAPTCTQDGTYRHQCIICQRYSESYASNPIGHAWSEINNDWHYCIRCGLENANGADGTIIMSDLTEEYGNGANYVVGYWNQGNVKFTKYVSIILENGEEIILEGIEFSEIEGLRAVVFSKAAVEAAATELGYSADEYLVRFAFVPYGADSTLDYAITFTETFDFENAAITDDINFKQYIGAGEMISFTISPTEDTVWTFTSAGSYDTYGYLYDAAGNLISSDDDSGEQANFLITYTLAEGETYTISVRWYHGNTSGYMPLIFDCTPVAQ